MSIIAPDFPPDSAQGKTSTGYRLKESLNAHHFAEADY